MWRSPILLATLLALPAFSEACSIESRRAGEPFSVPTSVVEVRVLELADEPYEHRKGRVAEGQRAKLEIVRSLVGSTPVGTTFEKHYMTDGCFGWRLARDTRVLMADFDGDGTLGFYELADAGESFDSVVGRFSDGTQAWRSSARPQLARVRLSGDIDDPVAERLLKESGLSSTKGCDIAVADDFAQVSCGAPALNEGSRARVIFEDVNGKWIEVLRWDPADLSPVGASAATTS